MTNNSVLWLLDSIFPFFFLERNSILSLGRDVFNFSFFIGKLKLAKIALVLSHMKFHENTKLWARRKIVEDFLFVLFCDWCVTLTIISLMESSIKPLAVHHYTLLVKILVTIKLSNYNMILNIDTLTKNNVLLFFFFFHPIHPTNSNIQMWIQVLVILDT